MKASKLPTESLTVYFDGGCPLCAKEISAYSVMPSICPIYWVDVSSCEEAILGEGLTRSAALSEMHVRSSDGKLHSRVDAFVLMWLCLAPMNKVGRVASLRLVKILLNFMYSAFLKVRPLWRPKQRCISDTCKL